MNKVIRGDILTLDTRSMLPIASGTCDGGDCDRRAVTFAYCSTGYAEGRDGRRQVTLNLDDLEALYLNEKERPTGTIGRDHVLALIAKLREAENGLFRVVQALGFDTDGTKNAKEFFGPMTYFKGQEQYTEPWEIAEAYAKEFRAEVERDADELEDRLYKYQDEAVKAWGRALNAEAVISEALNHDPLHGRKEGMHCGGMAPCIREILAAYES